MAAETSLVVYTRDEEQETQSSENGHWPATEPPPREEPDRRTARPEPAASAARRLVSLDAFRGLAILGMLLVNNAALDTATPSPLLHAGWNQGVHFADLVFPWFLLIVGVSIPFAVESHRHKGLPLWRYDLKLLSRAVTLVLLGCLLDSSAIKRPMFDLGVLQLIGLAYFVGGLLYELPVQRRLIIAAAFLVGHWAAIRFMPIPGIGRGVFTEQVNFIYHINRVYLQPVSLRGLISVVPLSALVLIGTALGDLLRYAPHSSAAGGVSRKRAGRVGQWLRRSRAALLKVALLLGLGLALLEIGWLWNLDLPFNKSVFTASYVLYAAGWGALVLAGLYLLIDVIRLRFWAFPLIVFGSNAIMAYVAPILVKIDILQEWKWRMPDGSLLTLDQALLHYCLADAGRIRGGWLYTGGYILFWWLVLFRMYRKGTFWRV